MFMHSLRKLARSHKYQMVYSYSKENGSLKLFKNNYGLTDLQLLFLHWILIYHSLYTDLSMSKENISNDVIEDDIRVEAYLLWRRTKLKEKPGKESGKKFHKGGIPGCPSITFTKK